MFKLLKTYLTKLADESTEALVLGKTSGQAVVYMTDAFVLLAGGVTIPDEYVHLRKAVLSMVIITTLFAVLPDDAPNHHGGETGGEAFVGKLAETTAFVGFMVNVSL